jgi:hypothetical protein
MHYLIDGYNLMHAAGLMKPRFGPGGLEKARRAVVGVLAASLGEDAAHTTIVFDARAPMSVTEREAAPTHGGMRVEFAAGEENADARIERLIAREPTPKQLAVVSSDRRIRAAAKRRGATSLDSDSFWSRFVERRRATGRGQTTTETAEKPGVGRKTGLDDWLREFQGLIPDADLAELAGPFAGESVDLNAEEYTSETKPIRKRR